MLQEGLPILLIRFKEIEKYIYRFKEEQMVITETISEKETFIKETDIKLEILEKETVK